MRELFCHRQVGVTGWNVKAVDEHLFSNQSASFFFFIAHCLSFGVSSSDRHYSAEQHTLNTFFIHQMMTWQRKAQTCGLHFFPVPSDPFALPYSYNSDPLRGPILIPLNVSCLTVSAAEPFAQFMSSTWGRRMHLFQVKQSHSISCSLVISAVDLLKRKMSH